LRVDYEAPQGRRVNGIGAYFTHGPETGAFDHETYVRFALPKGLTPEAAHQIAQAARMDPRLEGARLQEPPPVACSPRLLAAFTRRAEQHQVQVSDFGIIDGEGLVAFLWKISGRPQGAPGVWRRVRPLYVVLDNYSVHHSAAVKQAEPEMKAAGIHLVYLPAYSPELSRIEPLWQTTKHYEMPERSFRHLGDLKQTVDATLARRAVVLREAPRQETKYLFPRTP
jgi:hypothetical protein